MTRATSGIVRLDSRIRAIGNGRPLIDTNGGVHPSIPTRPIIAALALAILAASLTLVRARARASIEVIASNLFNPRGLAFGRGALSVAKAGSGGDDPSIEGDGGPRLQRPDGRH